MESSSGRCVNFIANLMPLFAHETVNGMACARNLRDGTLILPSEQDGVVTVWWQGDEHRASEANASLISSNAVSDYVQLNMLGKSAEEASYLLAHLEQHFEYKTGETLYLPYREDDGSTLMALKRVIGRVGPDIALDVLKKSFGL
ncbi:hypothetical protein H3221_018505 [Pseudomonas sp. LMG 31766]|uniref:Uncharacterized protein n=1 Tax=Pseudomonas chaetocerotis TaxID=2758695 RepID=A0A931GBW0_9PSED|nr:hypothetical protein [Pseudomonas chaetocerotis]MBZ9666734.1 hypothetical protein [Pseudomonas chaetocerotis]